MINQCVMCGAEMPFEEGQVCNDCLQKIAMSPVTLIYEPPEPPKPNTELSFGAGDEDYNFLINYHRIKPLNRFQIWMYKVCFGIRARNI